MTDREKQLRFNIKWNKIACYFGVFCAIFNAMIGSAFWMVSFALAVMNWWIAGWCEKELKEEGFDE